MTDGSESSPLVGLWSAMREGDVSTSALPLCHLQGSLWSALLFRASIHEEFDSMSDPQHISQRIYEICRVVPERDRERLLARREVEAIIRAEINNESNLVRYVRESPRSAFFAAQVVTREVFVAAAGAKRSESLAARIIEVWDRFARADWFYEALNVGDPRSLRSDEVASDVRSLAVALGSMGDGGER